jgi:hypothetical protein
LITLPPMAIAGTVVDFENIAGACPADPASCVAGFTKLTAELRGALRQPRKTIAAALPYTPVRGYFDYVGLNRWCAPPPPPPPCSP